MYSAKGRAGHLLLQMLRKIYYWMQQPITIHDGTRECNRLIWAQGLYAVSIKLTKMRLACRPVASASGADFAADFHHGKCLVELHSTQLAAHL